MLARTRRFFSEHGYWEVETPLLAREAIVDAHIDPLEVPISIGGRTETGVLQTSPEYHMKRLLSAGVERIFQLSHVFRGGEIGQRHNPEFTMLEWYAAETSDRDQMQFVEQLVSTLVELELELGALGEQPIVLPEKPWKRITYRDAFEQVLGIHPLETDVAQLKQVLFARGIALPTGMESGDEVTELLNFLMATRIEPWLATQGCAFLHDYPMRQAALAEVRTDEQVAERFELYLDGIEICNGYQELIDADELLRRMKMLQADRAKLGKPTPPLPMKLVEAQRHHFPACSGVALGFDRFLMWLWGRERIADVMAFGWDEA